ncbi:MAG: retention module-containing protein, partial [Pseudomonas sp.]|nr:retention module-containing protein [Pseudomonas sp.]
MTIIIAIVKSIVGQVFALSPEGTRRLLIEGDRLFAGDQVTTGQEGMISLKLNDGRILDLGRDSQWTANADTPQVATTPSAELSASELQQAITLGLDPTAELEATAAGAGGATGTGGAAGGGHSAVVLDVTGAQIEAIVGYETEGLGFAAGGLEEQSALGNDGGAAGSTPLQPNAAPLAQADTATTAEETPVTINVLANDTDVDGPALTIKSASVDPTQGTVSIVSGQLVFTPATNFTGTATITYVSTDGSADSAPTAVTVTVTPINDAPVAAADTATTAEETAVTIDVLANDTDVDGPALTIKSASVDPTQGTVSIVSGQLVFTPATNFTGTATITYVSTDGSADSAPTAVTVTVTPINDAPVAADQAKDTNEDQSVSGQIVASDVDGDKLSYTIQAGADHGSLLLNTVTGGYTYTPNKDYNGNDTFTIRVYDAKGAYTDSVVTVTVNPVDDAPVAAADTATTAEETAVTIDVLANDTDVDGPALTIKSASVDPTQGTVSIVSGQLVFTPATNFTGTATITYVSTDGQSA